MRLAPRATYRRADAAPLARRADAAPLARRADAAPLARVYALPLAVALFAIGPVFGQEPCCGPGADVTGGGWKGRWESCTTGHNGPLKARIRKEDCGHYRVVFRGRFRMVIPFRYAVTLNVVGQEGDAVLLAGESKVPFYGLFHYTAQVTETHFHLQYWSEKNCQEADRGKFEMSRCRGHKGCCD